MPGRREGSDLGPQGLCKRTGLTSLMSTASILFSSTKVLCLAPRQLAVSNWAAEGGLRVRMRGNAKGYLPPKHSLNAIPHLNSEPPEQHQPLANRGGIEEGKECSERRWNLEEEEDRVSADESPAAPVWREEGRGRGSVIGHRKSSQRTQTFQSLKDSDAENSAAAEARIRKRHHAFSLATSPGPLRAS